VVSTVLASQVGSSLSHIHQHQQHHHQQQQQQHHSPSPQLSLPVTTTTARHERLKAIPHLPIETARRVNAGCAAVDELPVPVTHTMASDDGVSFLSFFCPPFFQTRFFFFLLSPQNLRLELRGSFPSAVSIDGPIYFMPSQYIDFCQFQH
jgi:hypothetical protein